MTRFLYLTDTHWCHGAQRLWTLQKRDHDLAMALPARLGEWLKKHPVDFIIHGGDATHSGTLDQIGLALRCFEQFGLPVYLCLGNHDLQQPDSIRHWRSHGWPVFASGCPDVLVRRDDLDVHVIAHHWNTVEPPHHWDGDAQRPLLADGQLADLEQHLLSADRPVFLVVHHPVSAIPPSQTGHFSPWHEPDPAWRALMLGLLDRHPRLRAIFTAHNHCNGIERIGDRALISTAAFSESPFDARMVRVENGGIDIQTLSFAQELGLSVEYDRALSWVQGGPAERSCRLSCE